MNITAAQDQATAEIVDLVASRLGTNRAIHPETAISTCARLSGSLLLRSFNLGLENLEPGTVILSDQANEKGPMLVTTMAAFLSNANVQLDPQKLGGETVHRGEPPQFDVLASLSKLQDGVVELSERNGLGLEQAAQAAARATAFIVKECAPQIGAETGFNVAVYGFLEGSKTVPPRLASSRAPKNEQKPWYKFW